MPSPLIAFAAAMAVPYALAVARFVRAVGGVRRPRSSTAVFAALATCANILLCMDAVSLTGFFLAVWVAAIIGYGLAGGTTRRSFLIANTAAVCLMLACGLVFYGYMSVGGFDKADPSMLTMRGVLLITAQAVAIAGALALARMLDGAYPVSANADRALQPFFAFGFFAISYEILDLVPVELDVWFTLMPLFLFGGTALLSVFCGVFAHFTARLGAETFRESENIALERKKRDQEALLHLYRTQASTDRLTGLATRRVGQDHLERLAAEGRAYTVAFIDMDGLKTVNDARGHVVGDLYLQAFAHTLRTAFPEDEVIRWGGDEFLVVHGNDDETELAKRLDSLHAEANVENETMPIGFSFGLATSPAGAPPEEALRRADQAMYAAKHLIRQTHGSAIAATTSSVQVGGGR